MQYNLGRGHSWSESESALWTKVVHGKLTLVCLRSLCVDLNNKQKDSKQNLTKCATHWWNQTYVQVYIRLKKL